MQYAEGRVGRVFMMRIDDGEDLLDELTHFLDEKSIQHGVIHFLGALREGRLVTGPMAPVIPPVPNTEGIEGGWEILGIATVYPSEGGPSLHLHASAGHMQEVLTGCLRERAKTYLVVEAIIMEISGIAGMRTPDPELQVRLPVFGENG
jgi:predicted DNA-binding protein with PD1-like motif